MSCGTHSPLWHTRTAPPHTPWSLTTVTRLRTRSWSPPTPGVVSLNILLFSKSGLTHLSHTFGMTHCVQNTTRTDSFTFHPLLATSHHMKLIKCTKESRFLPRVDSDYQSQCPVPWSTLALPADTSNDTFCLIILFASQITQLLLSPLLSNTEEKYFCFSKIAMMLWCCRRLKRYFSLK